MSLRNALFAIGVFALLAGGVMGLTWAFSGSRTQVADSGRAAGRPAVLTATHALAAGALLRNEDMTWRDIQPGVVAPSGLLRGQVEASDFVGAVTQRGFVAGETLSRQGLVLPSERGFLAAVLSPGERAVTIAVEGAQRASGLLLPGDRVDVILVQDLAGAQGGGVLAGDLAHKSVAETVITNARVVAVGGNMNGPKPVDTKAPPNTNVAALQAATEALKQTNESAKTITLELNDVEAQRLFVAKQLGRLELSLRALVQGPGGPQAQTPPVWASDVSPALGSLTHTRPNPAGERRHASRTVHAASTEERPTLQILRGSAS